MSERTEDASQMVGFKPTNHTSQSKCLSRRHLCMMTAAVLLVGSVIAVIIAIFFNVKDTTHTEVSTTCGPIQGVYDANLDAYSFKGIPYAAPPTGERRWKPTVPLKNSTGGTADFCWTGVYKADVFGDQCPQVDPGTDVFKGSEDCLFLDVFTPSLTPKAGPLSVLVYLHGGYLLVGNGSIQGYAPDLQLAHELGAVFVSIQYRLNGLGFLVLEELGAEQTGNYGLWDQIEALRWVRDNIHNFGGDPNQVTIFGQSSGGTSVWALLMAPPAKGLFHRVWSCSGSAVMNKSLSDAAQNNRFFLNNTGCKTTDCLKNLTPEQVARGVNPQFVFAFPDSADMPTKGIFELALIVIDGELLPKPPFEMLDSKTGDYSDVPLMIGTTAQEVDFGPTPGKAILTWSHEQYVSYIKTHLDPFGNNITSQALSLYDDILSGGDVEYNLTTIISDLRMNCANDVLAKKMADALSSPVYRYVAASKPSTPALVFDTGFPASYAFHSIDMFAFFNSMGRYLQKPLQPSDKQFSQLMRENVMAFAKTGKPSATGWHYFVDGEGTAVITDHMNYTSIHNKEQCDFWLNNGFFSYSWIN